MLMECVICGVLYLYSAVAENVTSRIKPTEIYIPCEKGWFFFGDKCYKLGGKKKSGRLNWYKATDRCKEEGGTLATIYSEEIKEYLVTFLLLDAKTNAWIGLHDWATELAYLWQDGSISPYTSWEPNEPSGYLLRQGVDCVEMVFRSRKYGGKPGDWNDFSCNTENAYICQTAKSRQIKKTPDPRFCPGTGAWKYQNSCYNVVTEKKSWKNAEKHCQDIYDGHLVMIADFTDALFLDHILSNFNREIWVGIKIKEQLQQKWTSGWYVPHSGWGKYQGDFVDGTCVLRPQQNVYITTACSKKYSFVCQKSSVKPPVLQQSLKGAHCPELPEDWRDLGGDYCYFFDTTSEITWYQANFECMRRGGSLVSIHSSAEIATLHPFVKYTQHRLYIGLYRHEDVFMWSDGSHLDFKNWDTDTEEPNNKNARCGELCTEHMKWNDVMCEETKGYICSVRKISPNVTEINAEKHCSSGVSVKALIGVSVCILLLVISLIVVIYYLKPCGVEERRKKSKATRQPPMPTTERPRYRSTEFMVKEDDGAYENMH